MPLAGTALTAVTAAAVGGLAASYAAGYAIGEVLNTTDLVKGLQERAAAFAWDALHGENVLDHIKTPNVEVIGPWSMDVDPSTPGDNMSWFTLDGDLTSITLYDTPLDLINAGGGLTFDPQIYVLYTIP